MNYMETTLHALCTVIEISMTDGSVYMNWNVAYIETNVTIYLLIAVKTYTKSRLIV